ncbi:hypothetical protein KKC17_00110 [Patescibacteria group bacterium]|nr:hypothetical protein [Patescibacteria group bacterium]
MTLLDFIIIAKHRTYAAGDSSADELLGDSGKIFNYAEEDYKYQDKYFGFNPFSGQEIIWQQNKPLWTMNYYGQVFSDQVKAKEVYSFLRLALLEVRVSRPFRGPEEFIKGDWKYVDVSQGDWENFSGQEEIYFKNQKVYQLNYLGGILNK